MAKIIINNEVRANGKLSATRTLNEEKNGFIISGVFASHLYYESIKTLESERFALSGIEVYQEAFGSDDYDILLFHQDHYQPSILSFFPVLLYLILEILDELRLLIR